jgi:hypothetical protein
VGNIGRDLEDHPRARTRVSGLDSRRPTVDARMYIALTDMYAYALVLDAERQHVCDRLRRLRDADPDTAELMTLSRDRAAITAEVGLLQTAITALRQLADPAGDYL